MNLKKLISLILALTLMLSLVSFASADEASDDFYVYVGLKYGSDALDEAEISSDAGFLLVTPGRYGFTLDEDLTDYETLIIRVEEGEPVAYDEDGDTVAESLSGYVLMSAAEDIDDRIIDYGSKSYRDGMCFGVYSGTDTFAMANYTTLEHYVWGVVPNEIGSSYEDEAIKVQAVAARSFVMANLGYHGGGALSFDVCSKTHCQSFGGVNAEKSNITHNCELTRGEVIAYNGKVACAYYHSSNSGYTNTAEDVWGGSYGYLKAVRDEYTGTHNWEYAYTFSEMEEHLEGTNYEVGEIHSVEIIKRSANGAVQQLKISGSDGNVTISKSSIMSVFSLKSLWFSMGNDGFPELSMGKTLADSNLSVVTPKGTVEINGVVIALSRSLEGKEINLDGAYVATKDGVVQISAGSSEVDMPNYTSEKVTDGTAYLRGLGYGHGVGMCQSGANNMAKAGYSYKQILNHYYSDIEIIEVLDL